MHAASVEILVNPLTEEFVVIVSDVDGDAFPDHGTDTITERLQEQFREALWGIGFFVEESR
jgi:hypothetical protein